MDRLSRLFSHRPTAWCLAAALLLVCSFDSGRSDPRTAEAAGPVALSAGPAAVALVGEPPERLSDEDSAAEANAFLAQNLTGGRHYFIQISDTHIGGGAEAEREKQLFPKVHPTEKLRHALRIIAAFDPRPDFLLITGDLSDHSLPAEYDALKRVLSDGWTGPLALMRGNHDKDLGAFLEAFDYLPYTDPQRMADTGFCYAFDYEGVRVVCLDSEKYSSVLPESRWLADELALAGDRAVLVANHRHLFGTGNRLVDSVKGGLPQPEADAMAQQLRGARNLAGLLCGHIHYTSAREQDGIRQFTISSTFYAIEALGSVDGGLFARLVHVDAGEVRWTAVKDLLGATRPEWPAEPPTGEEAADAG